MSRVVSGTHVISDEIDGYFTMIYNRNLEYKNVNITIRTIWCVASPDGMGNREMSKTFRKVVFFELDSDVPVHAFLALRAWKLWRFTWDEFHRKKPTRVAYWDRELARLMGCHRAGSQFGPCAGYGGSGESRA